MADNHSHNHQPVIQNITASYVIGIVLNLIFVIIEVICGFFVHSLSLLSDAGHNLADVATLALSLLAFKLLKSKPNEQYTYGYRKTSILVALLNAMLLLVTTGAIIFEAIQRIIHPQTVPGIVISVVAAIGIIINTLTAFLFFRNKEKDINIKGAYLHLLSDAIVSFALVLGGVIIYFTQWYYIDSLLSIIVAIYVLISTWTLLKSSLRLSLDGVPFDINLDNLKAMAVGVDGVKDLHHIHVWAISTTENALTAHIVLNNTTTIEQEQKIKNKLKEKFLHTNIHHITIETERENQTCETRRC